MSAATERSAWKRWFSSLRSRHSCLRPTANPEGLPIEVFDGLRASLAKDPSQFYKDFALMFYGANRAGAKVSQGMLDQFWLWSMQASLKSIYECIKAFSETDFTEDLKKFDVPTLVLHGEDDQVVPVKDSAKKSAKLIRGATGNLLSRRRPRYHSNSTGPSQRRLVGVREKGLQDFQSGLSPCGQIRNSRNRS